MPNCLQTNTGKLVYHHYAGTTNYGVVFFGGFMSDMEGTKALYLEEYCKNNNIQFTRFDYFGHGQSKGKFTDGTISIWLDNCLAILDNICIGKQVIIGSSMGGWLMLLAALARPQRIKALIGIAAAPDFTEKLIYNELTDSQRQELEDNGVYHAPSCYDDGEPYPITKQLIEDGRKHLLLDNNIDIKPPVHLIHGMQDIDVPYGLSIQIAKQVIGDNVQLSILKSGDHRMSDKASLEILEGALSKFI